MSLAPFSIFVAIDAGNGIAKDGIIPWSSRADGKHFRDITTGRGRNAVIMGRITYETIPPQHRPLDGGRKCVIVSRTWRQEDHPDITIASSLLEALTNLGANMSLYDDVIVVGGEQIYAEAVRDFMYLCKTVYVTRFKTDYDCDKFFPFDVVKDMKTAVDPAKMRDYTSYTFTPKIVHPEYSYLRLMDRVLSEGEIRPDRAGVSAHSIFGCQTEYDVSERIPVFTTKKVLYDSIIKELLFTISGSTDSNRLEEQGCGAWKAVTSREYLDKNGKSKMAQGDMGPNVPHQWRHWGADYEGCDGDYRDKGVDQLRALVAGLRDSPHDSSHILSTWNVSQLGEMVKLPTVTTAQFFVSTDRRYLDCCVYQRCADLFIDTPTTVPFYAILMWMLGHVVGLRPRRLIHMSGDTYVFSNHAESAKRQIARTPRPFPTLKFRRSTKIKELDDFTFDDFIIDGYTSWPHLRGDAIV